MPLSALQQKFASQLQGGQFRSLNERLYTQSGAASLAMMRGDPSLFAAYHAGFRTQVSAWPRNPLDAIIAELRRAPRGQVVADFGCGEARLGATLGGGAAPHAVVHSFDLVAPPGAQRVTACDMAHVPLGDAVAHACVFCLSLMGTDYMAFLAEGVRVLRPGGRLLVAEIRSRFEGSGSGGGSGGSGGSGGGGGGGGSGGGKGGAEKGSRKRPREGEEGEEGQAAGSAAAPTGLQAFIAAVAALGCALERKDESNKMFVFLTFVKREGSGGGEGLAAAPQQRPAAQGAGGKKGKKGGKWSSQGGAQQQGGSSAPAASAGPALKPCIYKKR